MIRCGDMATRKLTWRGSGLDLRPPFWEQKVVDTPSYHTKERWSFLYALHRDHRSISAAICHRMCRHSNQQGVSGSVVTMSIFLVSRVSLHSNSLKSSQSCETLHTSDSCQIRCHNAIDNGNHCWTWKKRCITTTWIRRSCTVDIAFWLVAYDRTRKLTAAWRSRCMITSTGSGCLTCLSTSSNKKPSCR